MIHVYLVYSTNQFLLIIIIIIIIVVVVVVVVVGFDRELCSKYRETEVEIMDAYEQLKNEAKRVEEERDQVLMKTLEI